MVYCNRASLIDTVVVMAQTNRKDWSMYPILTFAQLDVARARNSGTFTVHQIEWAIVVSDQMVISTEFTYMPYARLPSNLDDSRSR
jgi:hypothetical protein